MAIREEQQGSSPSKGTLMRAIVQRGYGTESVLTLGKVPRPTPAPDEVLIRVHAAGLDRGVWHIMTGKPYLLRPAFGFRTPRQPVPGLDVAGTVTHVGASVKRFTVGDEVYGIGAGSFAEYAVAKEDKLALKPTRATFESAAVVPVSALTALQGLQDVGRVQAGQSVLITGASGGVGSFAVQLAKAFGAETTAVCSTGKVDFVSSLGADRVIDYTTEDFAQGQQKYDLILDIGGNPSLTRLRRSLTPRGTAVMVGGEGGGNWIGVGRSLRAVMLNPFIRQNFRMFVARERGADLERITGLIDAGTLTPQVDRIYPLAQAPEAMRQLEQRAVKGKLAITV
ncbi:NAD(P)-dependent alcohol dehydrogenase [Arthrobacter sp. CAN_A1]|uniref:NAD(P)-dependent alcohol dehydrogenase n=1 Tax=Arthrobacter sp. CAN_A1 TaxID=2787717 RepID=UPI001A1FD4D0